MSTDKMDKPGIASRTPFPVEVEKGKTCFWCSCGLSDNQPFCDGSHQGTGRTPIKYTAERTKIVFFCGCKQSASAPVCDGSHSRLPPDPDH
ncbi:MAG: CDGSH iron-sulfur domain-containing protein [Alcanivoracaceae bacterium]|jgi:CDGSH-type Zn-finger protein|nr:CDGSH iron-sulfur domain-containing protein [Alcanivoracaceae bacterium]